MPLLNCFELLWYIQLNIKRIWRYKSRFVLISQQLRCMYAVYPVRYAKWFAVISFVVVMLSFIVDPCHTFTHILQGYFNVPGAIVRLSQCWLNNPGGYGQKQLISNYNTRQKGHFLSNLLIVITNTDTDTCQSSKKYIKNILCHICI